MRSSNVVKNRTDSSMFAGAYRSGQVTRTTARSDARGGWPPYRAGGLPSPRWGTAGCQTRTFCRMLDSVATTSTAVLEIAENAPVPAVDPTGVEIVDSTTPAPRGSDFAQLSQRIAAAGLMKRRPGYYTAKVIATVGMYAAGWVAFAFVGASWWQLGIAAFLAFAYTQVAFMGHDTAHRQMFRTRTPSEVTGLLLGGLGVGMSFSWWSSKHTRHHANPNHEDHDPDVEGGPLVWTRGQAGARRNWLSRFLTRRQGTLFFPLLLLEGLNLHVAGIKEIVSTPDMRHRRWEAVLMTAHIAIYLTAVFWVLPVGMGFAFIAVHQALFGLYMGSCFAPNHKGMPVLTAADDLDFLRRQVLTSRNIKGGVLVDFMVGGLNYQIEHHLFPSMPRANLRKAQPIVSAYCAEIGVSYLQSGLISSYQQALSYLNDVGQAAVKPVEPAAV